MNIEKYRKQEVSQFNYQIDIQRNILSKVDSYYGFLDVGLIRQAVELAINARKVLDPFTDNIEIKINNIAKLVTKVYSILQQKNFKSFTRHEFQIPKTRDSNRTIHYIPIEFYVIRFMIAIKLNEQHKISDNVFGGKQEVFSIVKGDVYWKTNETFWDWQKEVIKSGKYSWVLIADVKKYYESINIEKLNKFIIDILSDGNSYILNDFISSVILNVDISNWCDNFIQNIYFQNLDIALSNKSWKYGRITDDIRIYTKTEEEANLAFKVIESELEKLELYINESKQFITLKYGRINDLMDIERYANLSNDKQIWTSSPYIKLSRIEEIEIENVLQIGNTSTYTYIRPKYYEDKIPKKVTLLDLVEGKSGFHIDQEDIYSVLKRIDKKSILIYDIALLEKLGDIILYTYGNYNHYNRVIKYYLIALSRASTEVVSIHYMKIWKYFEIDQLSWYESKRLYKVYLLLNHLYFTSENGNSLFDIINEKNNQFEKFITDVVFEGLLSTYQNSFFRSFVKYIFDFGIISLSKNNVQYWKDINYWSEKIEHVIDNEKYWHDNIINLCDFLLEWFSESPVIHLYKAKGLMNNYKKEEAIQYFDYAFRNLSTKERIEYYFEYAYCLAGIGKKNDALRYYSIYLNTYNSSAAYNNRALIYKDLNKYISSEKDFKNAIRISDSDRYINNLLDLYIQRKQYKKGINMIGLLDIEKRDTEFIKKKAIFEAGTFQKESAIKTIKSYCSLKNYLLEDDINEEISEVLGHYVESNLY